MKFFGFYLHRESHAEMRTQVIEMREERDRQHTKAVALLGQNGRQRVEIQDLHLMLTAKETRPFEGHLQLQQTEALLCEALAMLMWYQSIEAYTR